MWKDRPAKYKKPRGSLAKPHRLTGMDSFDSGLGESGPSAPDPTAGDGRVRPGGGRYAGGGGARRRVAGEARKGGSGP
jgi:hypothetical protein